VEKPLAFHEVSAERWPGFECLFEAKAYPVDADSPSYRFMGFVPVFAEAGFAEVGREGKRRHVMRLKLSSPRRSKK
jgi:hypothetical protein